MIHLPWSCFQLCLCVYLNQSCREDFIPTTSQWEAAGGRGTEGWAQPGCGAQLPMGPARSCSLRWFSTEQQPWLAPQAAPRSVAGMGVQCLTHLHRSHPGRNKSVCLKNTLFFSCDKKCSSPAWTPADPAPSNPGAGDPWSCEHLEVLGASHSSAQRGFSHPVPLAEGRFLLQSLLVHVRP